ncbi:MAG: C1 family peptidase, partial [Planctomycetaceae bacterium]|nr:C1 family peptidase [Planctomycetaceae bacterium]
LSEFFDEEIQKRLSNKKGHELIVQEITPILQMKMAQLAAGCEAFINDDELFTNNRQFTDEPLIIDDVDAEAMQTFINANNALLNTEEQKEEAVFSESGDSIVSPLSKIKKLRTEIIRTTANIRRLEKEVEELGSQVENIEDAKKSLTEDGFFEFGGISYQLLPKIEEKPLEEDYAPHEVKSTAIDLRSGFTAIKNQGQVGACTAFSLTSIYEYILKSNKLQECDLSEAFLYYNARKKDGKENELTGSRIDLAIETLVENGICLEEKWVNKQGGEEEIRAHYTTEPSQEAKDDAALRKVKKAVNVKLTLNDIRSALEDGYPVEFCTTLFDTFGNNAVVTYPSEDEMKQANFYDNQSRYHAMVICGYSDEEKLFVVRNSWGTEFGDKGYCYIPYSYITNSELTPCAYAITEVATTNVSAKKGIVKRTSLPFGDDVKMKFAIKKNALEEEKRILAGIISYYSSLKNQYNELHEQILNPHNQTALTTSTQTRLTNERQELETQYTAACDNMDEQLNVFANNTKSKAIRMAMPFALVMLIAEFYRWLFKKGLLCLNDFDSGMFDYLYREGFAILWIGIIALVTVGGFALWRIIGRKNHKENASQLMDYDKTTKRVRTVLIISFLIIGILVGIYSIFYDKQLGEKMLDYMYQKSLWVILLSFIIGIITVSAFIYLRIKKRKQLKEELQVVCDDRFNLVELKKRELKENRLRMHFAGMLLDKNSEVEHNLTKKYQFMQSFFVNLNTWHTLENASLKTMDDQVQAPFISVINNECLDKYFEQNGKELTKNISFCDVFVKNYQLSEDGIAAFQITLKRTFCEELLASISGFTIYDYFARPGEKLFLESKAPKALLSELETKSDVFVQHSKSPNTSKNLFVFTRNEDEKHSWLAISRPHFSCSPTQSPIVSPLKLVLTQMEELSASDLYL